MSDKNVSHQVDSLDWYAEKCRATVFTKDRVDSDSLVEVWKSFCEQEPEDIHKIPRVAATIMTGAFSKIEGALLELVNEPPKLEWRLASVPNPKFDEVGVPCIDTLARVLEAFVPNVRAWLASDKCPALTRLAFGAILNKPSTSYLSALTQLQTYLRSVQIDTDNMQDLMFRVNRPRQSKSGVSGVTINRLSIWSINRLLSTEIDLGAPTKEVASTNVYCANLVLDINNAPRQEPLSREAVLRLFDELLALGKEIAAKGDTA